jgi:hypothetical protein
MAGGTPLTEGMLVYDGDNQLVVAFGGRDKHVNKTSDASDALLVLDTRYEDSRWLDVTNRATGVAPGKVFASAGVYWPTRQQVVFYGGSGNVGLVALDTSRGVDGLRWLRPAVPGEASRRSSHSAVYAPDLDQMLVFGGTSGNTGVPRYTLDDVLAVRPNGAGFLVQPLAVQGERPPARYDHSAIYDSANQRMIVFGGQLTRRSRAYADVWALDMRQPDSPFWVKLDDYVSGEGPGPRAAHSAVYDPLRQQMVVFGGKGATAKEVWVLHLAGGMDGLHWERTVAADMPLHPGGPSDHGAVWVPDQDCMIVYGGWARGAESAGTWMHHPADSMGHRPPPAPPACDPADPASACGVRLMARVFVDTRCDGVFNRGHDALLAGVRVTLRSPIDGQAFTATTDANGMAYFDRLDVPGRQALTLTVDDPQVTSLCGYDGPTMPVPADRFRRQGHGHGGHGGMAVLSVGVAPAGPTNP